MGRLDRGGSYPAAGYLIESGWAEALGAEEFTGALRSAMREEYADASAEEMGEALANVLDSMSPAEGFNFTSALNQIVSHPTFAAVAKTALPIAGGLLGTAIGGPVGTALGSQLGNLAASALPTPAGPRPAAPRPAALPPAAIPPPAPGAGSRSAVFLSRRC